MLVPIAEQLLTALDEAAPGARSAADTGGDPAPLAGLVRRVSRRIAGAGAFDDPGAIAELRATHPALAEALLRWRRAPLDAEAEWRAAMSRARVAVAGASLSLAAAMERLRAPDEALREAAREGLERTFTEGDAAVALERLHGALTPLLPPAGSRAARPAAPPAAAPPRRGAILLPSAELIAAFSGGPGAEGIAGAGPSSALEAAIRETAGAAGPSRSPLALSEASREAALRGSTGAAGVEELDDPRRGDRAGPSPALQGPPEKGAAPLAPPGDGPGFDASTPETRGLLHALAESITGRPPASFGAWRAAAAAAATGDFRPRPELPALRGVAGLARLPFEQPGVPLARAGAAVPPGFDAAASNAHLLAVPGRLGPALASTAPAGCFVRGALRDPPVERVRASRAFALALLWRAISADLALRACGQVEALRDVYQDLLGHAPPPGIARVMLLEVALAELPGEGSARYASSPELTRALLAGPRDAAALRDGFDEDWFANPRAQGAALEQCLREAERRPAPALADWLQAYTRL